MALTAREQEAWQALRRTSTWLRDDHRRAASAVPRSSSKQPYCGYSPAHAAAALVAAGWPCTEAQATLRRLVLQRFAAFADSWNSYLSAHGFLFELDRLPPEVQAEYEQRFQLAATREAADALADAGPLALVNPTQLLQTIGRLNRLQHSAAVDSPDKHPALPALLGYYGLEPELAHAVVLYQRAVPPWVIALIFGFAVLAGLVAVVNFASSTEVALEARVAAPLFSLLFLAVAIWLWRDAPRRSATWQAALERCRAAWTIDAAS